MKNKQSNLKVGKNLDRCSSKEDLQVAKDMERCSASLHDLHSQWEV